MATKKLTSIKGRVVRITRLDECGVPVIGMCSTIVTKGFIKVTIGREEQAGDEYLQKNAWGEFCVNEKDPDLMKWANVSVQFCEIDPGVLDIMGGATPVIAGADTIGAMFGPDAPVGAFAIEVWTKKAGVDACVGGVVEWGYFAVPFIRNGKLDGDVTIENAPLNITIAGQGMGAPAAWGVTPYGDNPMRRTGGMLAGQNWVQVVTNVQPPAATAGCVELNDRTHVTPGDVFPANTSVTAQDSTNAALLVGLGYTTSGAAWATGEFFTIGTFKFNWTGTVWAAGIHA